MVMNDMRVLWILSVFVFFVSAPVSAAMNDSAKKLDTLAVQTDKILKNADEDQVEEFQKIRAVFGTLRAVHDVQGTLENAQKSCVENYPDMTDKIEKAITAWKKSVFVSLEKGDDHLSKMIADQKFAPQKDLRAYLDLYDRTITKERKKVPEIPITDEKACKNLFDELGDNGKNLADLILETLDLDTKRSLNE